MQRRTLIRARDLAAFRDALIERALRGGIADIRRRAVIVPTRAAGEILRQTIEQRLNAARRAVILPDFLTRAELMERLLSSAPGHARWLSRQEREILVLRAARLTASRSRVGGAPFPLRPGLVAAMLDFYDELRRRGRSPRRFAGTLFEELGGALGEDRGTEGLIRQTCFLAFAFLAYERAVRATDGIDEHVLRALLLAGQPALPYAELVVAVADHPADPRGLWPADFDLLGRLRALTAIEIVTTDGLHDLGFRERIEVELPGIEEDRRTASYPSPVLLAPGGGGGNGEDDVCFISRDREEELRDVARAVRVRAAASPGNTLDRTAIVFHRPLPYLYLSLQVLAEARVPHQAFDALPLAAEPYAAMLDVVITAAMSGATREAALEILRSGLLRVHVDGAALTPADLVSLEEALTERRSGGEADSFAGECEAYFGGRARRRGAIEPALRAAAAAAGVRHDLADFRRATRASSQVGAVLEFIRAHERLPAETDSWRDRHLRARAAVQGVLAALIEAFARHDDDPRRPEDLAAVIRHAIEAQTFVPRRGAEGVHLVDAVAARFGQFDHAHLVGLVETDWPERPTRSVFYTSGLLKSLGWPQETDQARVQQAMFTDLLGLPARTVTLHGFQLEGDAIVAASPLVELARDVPRAEAPLAERPRTFDDEVLTMPAMIPGLDDAPAAWLALRHLRPELGDSRYSGYVEPRAPERYRVSRVDHYVDCPFKYFAENVLKLPEERDELAGLTPLERGNLIHELFERFYREWDDRGLGTITAARLPDAVALFTRLTEEALERFPEADRALERARLLGSLVSPGVGERVFELEADRGGSVVGRLLEQELKGPFVFPVLGGLKTRTVEITGKADRIDVFDDGSLRVVDYKLSRLPDIRTSIQIAVYALAARQKLEAADGRQHPIAAAMYLAFGDEDRLEGSLGSKDEPLEIAVGARAGDFAAMVERIEAGVFPPQPKRMSDCAWCRYAGVCRKEYKEGDDETAEPV